MNAKEYLKARDIKFKDLENFRVGRLSVVAEFKIGAGRGVVLCPKRGSVSERYLSILADDGIKYVIAESPSGLSFYGKGIESEMLVSWRSLPVVGFRSFPLNEVLNSLSVYIRLLAKKHTNVRSIAANILFCRINDEEQKNFLRWEAAINSQREKCSDLISAFDSNIISLSSDSDIETLLKICGIISGFSLIPSNDRELAILLEWLGQLGDGTKRNCGLPVSLSFIFEAVKNMSTNIEVATSALGSQLIALSGVSQSSLIIENEHTGLSIVFKKLFPASQLITSEYISYSPKIAPDTIVLLSPFGQISINKAKLKEISPYFTENTIKPKIQQEYLYILHAIEHIAENGIVVAVVPEGILSGAGHVTFRNWLLGQIQILGVISLPTGLCFEGTSLRCSLLFMKRRKTIPTDYPITMMELRDKDLNSAEIREEIKKLIHKMLSREVCR